MHCSSYASPLLILPRTSCGAFLHAMAWHAERLHAVSFTHSSQKQARAVQRTSARLLDKLRALERQRRGLALLGCCLGRARLGARLVNLGTTVNHTGVISRTGASRHCSLSPSSVPPRCHAHGMQSGSTQLCTHRGVQRPSLLPHVHSQLRACLTSSAR